MKQQIKGSIMLLIATFIWGTAFVAQSVGMDYIEPFTFQTMRSFIAVIALFLASGLQQVGLVHTDPGKAGFITAMYIVLVPVLRLFLGQQRLSPAPASLIMSLESVFAVLAGWIVRGQGLSASEGFGCAPVFAGVVLSLWEPKQ